MIDMDIRVMIAAAVLVLSAGQLHVSAREGDDGTAPMHVRVAYDVDFEMYFDNREYDVSDFSQSGTIFGARITPSLGLSLRERSGGEHRVMVGIDIMKDFGASPVDPSIAGAGNETETSSRLGNWDLFRDISLYYRYSAQAGRTGVDVCAGVFPRKFMKGEYSDAFFSDSLRYYDNNIEGLLVSFRRPSSYYEVGCDWMGMYGIDRRERFMIFSSGASSLSDMLTLGYSAYLYHYAGAKNVTGVVDNALLNPYMGFDFTHLLDDACELSLRIGWLQSLQNDRQNVGHYVYPHGGEFTARVGKWNAGIENYLFYGTSMMPYFAESDAAGNRYGSLLYPGDPFYKVSMTGKGLGFYDRLEMFYEPDISDFLSVRVAAVLNFNDWVFSGWQQIVSLRFNLQSLLTGRSHRAQ